MQLTQFRQQNVAAKRLGRSTSTIVLAQDLLATRRMVVSCGCDPALPITSAERGRACGNDRGQKQTSLTQDARASSSRLEFGVH